MQFGFPRDYKRQGSGIRDQGSGVRGQGSAPRIDKIPVKNLRLRVHEGKKPLDKLLKQPSLTPDPCLYHAPSIRNERKPSASLSSR
jgi:hypothetical protein